MRTQSILSEAWRNLARGTTHAGLWALVLICLVGGLAWADIHSVVNVLDGAQRFRDAGGAVQILAADDAIDGARCDDLARLPGVTGSGALRDSAALQLAVLPSLDITMFEGTLGIVALLDAPTHNGGLVLSRTLNEALGSPAELRLRTGQVADVAGTYRYPDDGRAVQLSFAALAPIAAQGTFDACWVEIWPTGSPAAGIIRYSLTPTASASLDPSTITQSQLNSTLGAEYDTPHLLTTRLTRHAPWFAAFIGAVLGVGAVWSRRLELASARHAGVRASELALQLMIETAMWTGATVAILAPVLWWTASHGHQGDPSVIWWIGLRTIIPAAITAVLMSTIAAANTRPSYLFRYFKDR